MKDQIFELQDMIDHRSYTDNLNSFEIKARIKTALFLCIAAMINHVLVIVRNCYLTHNLGQNKKKQLTPSPPRKKKKKKRRREGAKTRHFGIIEMGGEGWQFFTPQT